MKTIVIAAVALLAQAAAAQAALRIIATVPDLADITRRIGGVEVQVESLAKGTEDIHNVPQRPSFLPKLNRADGVVLVGLDLEHAFLPALLEVAQNPRILPGRPGYIDCSAGLAPMEVPATLSRAEGELHPHGNPHYNMDPRQGALIARNIADGLARLDPAHRTFYEMNRDDFIAELDAKIAGWREAAKAVQGAQAVSHHKDMTYLADFLGLQLVGTVELKPGIAPTPTHLEHLVQKMKAENVPLIIREIQFSEKTAKWLARHTGAKVASVATMAGAFPDTQTYFGFVERNIRAVTEALK